MELVDATTVGALTERRGEGGGGEGPAKCIRASEKRALWKISGLSRRGFKTTTTHWTLAEKKKSKKKKNENWIWLFYTITKVVKSIMFFGFWSQQSGEKSSINYWYSFPISVSRQLLQKKPGSFSLTRTVCDRFFFDSTDHLTEIHKDKITILSICYYLSVHQNATYEVTMLHSPESKWNKFIFRLMLLFQSVWQKQKLFFIELQISTVSNY